MSGAHGINAQDMLTVSVNGGAESAPVGSSLHDLVEALGFAGRHLVGGEQIEIVTFVGGG